MAGQPWTRDETLVAFNVYSTTPFGRLHARNPEIIHAAAALGRTPDALAMKCCNLASLDPQLNARGVQGLSKVSRIDRDVWNEFQNSPAAIGFESEMARERLGAAETPPEIEFDSTGIEGLDRPAMTKARIHQAFFRRMILSGYRDACAVCTLPIRKLLVASHIIPWAADTSLRLNPTNGICLCVLHDKAFDRHLLSISADYTIHIHAAVSKHQPNPAAQQHLLAYHHQPLHLPDRWHPNPELLTQQAAAPTPHA